MPDLGKLTPAERASQLGKPEGEVGIAIGEFLNRNNCQVIDAAYRCLELSDGMKVLEVGFGNGHTVPELLAHANRLQYTGIEISETMLHEAVRFNRTLVDSAQATFRLASVEAIPCMDASFDRVVAVNVIYFLADPGPALREIRRVLCPSGFSVIASIEPSSAESAPFAKAEFGFHVWDSSTLVALHRAAGFRQVEVLPHEEIASLPDGTQWPRRYNLVTAKP
jgi:ubiquinone/menaquinone biosynthesis C-methylase UbiE